LIASGKHSDLQAYQRYVDLAVSTPNHGLDALALAKEALLKYPDDAVALTIASKAALAAGLPAEAQKYIDAALKIDPKSKDAAAVQEVVRKTGTPAR